MKSMTGYGRGEASREGIKITTEITSVNRKQSEITVYLPRELEPLEAQARQDREERLIDQAQANKELIRNLAHEIKNPLGGIRGASRLKSVCTRRKRCRGRWR